MSEPWIPLAILVGTMLALLGVKRWITRRLQELSYRWVGDGDVALILYFVIVLPGVVIHELSHWLVATVLGVRVSKLSIGPVRKGRSGRVSLGSVQVAKVDPIRSSLIGLAPLLGASAIILLISNRVLGVGDLAATVDSLNIEAIMSRLGQLTQVADFWLWVYLIFAISNAMLPSESDMAEVRPVLIFLGVATALVLVVWGVPTISPKVVSVVTVLAGYLAYAFSVTLAVDVVFVLVIWVLTWLTRRLRGA